MKRRAPRFAARFIPHNSYLIPFPFAEPKPQQTGTGLLIRLGEVATTSGSTILRSELTPVRSERRVPSTASGRRRAGLHLAQNYGWQANSIASWCNSSMLGFDPDGLGANPSEAANPFPPGSEIASRLAYTQKSRGQNLLGRPAFAKATAGRPLLARHSAERDGGPRCIIRSAPVSDTGGPGAKPGEAANFRRHA